MCAGQDSNLRSPKAIDLQSIAIDRSATGATAAVYQKQETERANSSGGYSRFRASADSMFAHSAFSHVK